MINITRWSPDTCDCVIEYEWDTDTSEDERVHTAHAVLVACDAHSYLGHDKKDKHFATVIEESQRKNNVHGIIAENFPELTIDEKVNGYKWSFDKERNLIVEVTGATPAHNLTIQKLSNQKFGVGKVQVN